MENKKIKHLLLIFFSLIILGSTLFLQTESKNKEELTRVTFGLPFAFIAQDHSEYYSFSYFPTWDKFNFKDWQNVKNLYPLKFIGSLFSIFIILEVLVYVLESIDFWARNKFFKEKEMDL